MEEQCKGTTKSGQRCKNRTNLVDGYCRLHRDQAVARETPSEPKAEEQRRVGRRVQQPTAPQSRPTAEKRGETPAETRAEQPEKPRAKGPSESLQPPRETTAHEDHFDECRWLAGIVTGMLLVLTTLILALVGRRRR